MSCESRAASGWLPRARTRTPAVKRLLVWIEALLTAVAFAEEGEPDTARRIAEDAGRDQPGDGGERAR